MRPACHLEGDSNWGPDVAPPRGPGPDPRVHLLPARPREADSAVMPIPRGRKPSPSPFRVPPERLG